MDVSGGGSAVLELAQVSKVFVEARMKKIVALEGISFKLAPGEFISLIGPSGCGKSTILRLSAGLDTPTQGEVFFKGQPLMGPGQERGFVFQAYNAFPWLTVRENVGFGLSREDAKRKEKVDRWLAFTGLADFAEQYPKVLSGGMRQRLALARTMITEPALLLLDEPFGALDEKTREGMQSLLLGIVQEMGCSVILVTHDIREAILLGDRILMLGPRPGKILRVFEPPFARPRDRKLLRDLKLAQLYEEIVDDFPS